MQTAIKYIRNPEEQTDLFRIPAELRELPQWVCWRLEPDKEGKLTKVPKVPDTGGRAQSNNPKTWRSFEVALNMYCRRESYSGIGFVFTESDQYFCIDLDHVIDDSGTIQESAQNIIHHFNSYTEVSQSGHGIHIIGSGKKPDGSKCRTAKHPQIEVYEKLRYVAITGKSAGMYGTAGVSNCHLPLQGFLMKYGLLANEPAPVNNPARGVEVNLSDEELIQKMRSSRKNGNEISLLLDGDTSGQSGDDSAADIALCNHLAWWCNKDKTQMDRIFRQSGLYCDKWGREDYRTSTLERACASTSGGYEPPAKPARKARAKKEDGVKTGIADYHFNDLLTDTGNAETLVSLHGDNLRYDVSANEFLLWNGKNWEYDKLGKVEQLSTETIKTYYRKLETIPDLEDQKKMIGHIRKSLNAYGISSMLDRTKYQQGIPITAGMLDNDIMLLNCRNGTVDLHNGNKLPHSKAQLLTKIVDVDYEPTATCPTWDKFISGIFCNDVDLIHYVQKALGYALTGDVSEQVFFILYGKGSNGKSTLLETLANILKDYHKSTQTDTFIENDKSSSASYDIAKLPGTRIITAIETKEGRKLNEQLVKQVTGGDTITARAIYGKPFDYKPQFKLFLAVNHLPTISGQDFGIWRRIRPIPFKAKFEGKNDDKSLKVKLAMEYPGILNWLVKGCIMWQSEALGSCKAIEVTKNKYQSDMDILGEFFGYCCVINPSATVKSSILYKVYQDWANGNGMQRPLTQTNFSRKLEERGDFTKERTMHGVWWYGIGLKDDFHNDNNDSNENDTEELSVDQENYVGYVGYEPNSQSSLGNDFHREFPENPTYPTYPTLNINFNTDNNKDDTLLGVEVNDQGGSDQDTPPDTVQGKCIQCKAIVYVYPIPGKQWEYTCSECGCKNTIPNWRIDDWQKENQEKDTKQL